MELARSVGRYVRVVPLSRTTGKEMVELVQDDVPLLPVIDKDVIKMMKSEIVLVRGSF